LSSTFAYCRRTISNFTPTPLKIFPRNRFCVRICESQDIYFTVDAAGKVAVGQGAARAKRRKLATLGGSDDLRNQYLLAIVTDCAIGLIGPFPTDAKAALNGR
jgi:hypothetical protein